VVVVSIAVLDLAAGTLGRARPFEAHTRS